MSTIEWPDHLLTLAEWEKLPEDGRFKVEVVEGVLAVSPRPLAFHQLAVHALVHALHGQLPATVRPLAEFEVVLSSDPVTIRIPDVIVATTEVIRANPARVHACDVQLVIEVLSDGTRRVDRVLKFADYADAGIPQYWLVDPVASVTVTTFALVDGAYEQTGEYTDPATVRVADAEVGLVPSSLTEL